MNAKSLLTKICDHVDISTPGNCLVVAYLLAKYLPEKTANVSIVEGYVYFKNHDSQETSKKFEHTWIIIDGQLVDPTLIQFNPWDLSSVEREVTKVFTPFDYQSDLLDGIMIVHGHIINSFNPNLNK